MASGVYPVIGTLLTLMLAVPFRTGGAPSSVTVGGLFSTEQEERVFRYAVNYVNRRNIIGHDITLDYIVNVTDYTSTYQDIQLACQMAERGVAAIIGPMSSTSVTAVSPVATALHIPLIAPTATNPHLGQKTQYPFLVRMFPPDSTMNLALADLVAFYGWKKMTILMSGDDYGVNGMTRFQSEAAYRGWMIYTVQRFQVVIPPTDINATSQLKLAKDTGVRVIILHCTVLMAKEVLRQAQAMDMTGPGWAWVVTDGTTDMRAYATPGLIGIAPALRPGLLYQDFTYDMQEMNEVEDGFEELDVFSALIVDAVLTFAYGVRTMYDDPANDHVDVIRDPFLCENTPHSHWEYGQLMLNCLSAVEQDGVASQISFDSSAAALHPVYDIVNLKPDGWVKVGAWEPKQGLLMNQVQEVTFMGGQRTVLDYTSRLANQTLSVVTVDGAPFISLITDDYDDTDLQPHDVEGYCIDMLNKLAELAGFKYHLHMQRNGNFGFKDPTTGEWNGMVRELVMRETDMAVSYTTITPSRDTEIDFTVPYLSLGMGVIMKKPEALPVRPFTFMDPFTIELWVFIMVTMLLVAGVISLFNKISPSDYHGGLVYAKEGRLKEGSHAEWKTFRRLKDRMMSTMDFPNAVFFSAASLLGQGGEAYPKSLSGRIVCVTWWFAIVILTSTYTANLTAFLTASRIQTGISSVEELAAQTKISYGTREFGSLRAYLRDSSVALYRDMYTAMNTRGWYVRGQEDGFARVRTGTYAWIGDMPLLEFKAAQRPCDLQVIGRPFGKVGYGIALQKNSPYTEELDLLILQLRESGFMDDLKHKWFVESGECGGGQADSSPDEEESNSGRLQYTHVLGVFYIIYGALALSCMVVAVEFVIKCSTAVDKKDPLRPRSLSESVRKHTRMFKIDLVDGWLPRLPAIALGCLQSVYRRGRPGTGSGVKSTTIVEMDVMSSRHVDNTKYLSARNNLD